MHPHLANLQFMYRLARLALQAQCSVTEKVHADDCIPPKLEGILVDGKGDMFSLVLSCLHAVQ